MVPPRDSNTQYFIKTYGCTYNLGDSLKIESLLKNMNFVKTDIIDQAEILIINTCAVKHATEVKILHYLSQLKKTYPEKKIVVTGCLPQIGKKSLQKINQILTLNDLIIKPNQINQIPKRLGLNLHYASLKSKSSIIPQIERKQKVGIVQLSEGCNNSCSYCCTTIARGKLISFNPKDIVNQIKKQYSEGIKQFFLSSQDLGNYNFRGEKLHDLLYKISNLQGNFQIRLGMLNPEYLIENQSKFMPIFDDHRFFRFIHIPIQSASNNVLKSMKRNYLIEDVEKIIRNFIIYDKKFTFSTDIIVGYPSETLEDFEMTYKFINKWQPFVLNVSKFSVRENTLAKKMKQLTSQEIKIRSKKIHVLYEIYSKNLRSKWIGWKGKVFLTESKFKQKYLLSRNLYYVSIALIQNSSRMVKKTEIVALENYSLIGK